MIPSAPLTLITVIVVVAVVVWSSWSSGRHLRHALLWANIIGLWSQREPTIISKPRPPLDRARALTDFGFRCFQLGHRRKSDRVLSADAGVHGADEQVPHVLSATEAGQWFHLGRHKGEPSAGLRNDQGIQSDYSRGG